MSDKPKRGGWHNPASRANGRKGGRPAIGPSRINLPWYLASALRGRTRARIGYDRPITEADMIETIGHLLADAPLTDEQRAIMEDMERQS
jgi:hypothetical protein